VLVDRCMDQLRAAGISRCNIFLFADNHDAKRFWRAVGFVERRDLTLLQRVIDGRC